MVVRVAEGVWRLAANSLASRDAVSGPKVMGPCATACEGFYCIFAWDDRADNRASGGDIFDGLHNIHRNSTRGSGGRWIQDKYDDGIRVLPALGFICGYH